MNRLFDETKHQKDEPFGFLDEIIHYFHAHERLLDNTEREKDEMDYQNDARLGLL